MTSGSQEFGSPAAPRGRTTSVEAASPKEPGLPVCSAPPQLHVHLGFHKTATTFLQATLRINLIALNEAGVGYAPLSSVRKNLTRQFDRMSEFDIRTVFTDLAGPANRRLILSDENLCGSYAAIRAPTPYGQLTSRLARIVRSFPGFDVTAFFGIRPFSDFIPSAYSEYLRHHSFISFDEFVSPIRLDQVSWYQVLAEAIRQHSRLRFVLYDFTAFPQIRSELLRHLSFDVLREGYAQATASRESFTDKQIEVLARRPNDRATLVSAFTRGEHRQGAKFRPFPADITNFLHCRYRADMHLLASCPNVSILGAGNLDPPPDPRSPPIHANIGRPVSRTCVVFQCHNWSQTLDARYRRLAREVGPDCRCHVMVDVSNDDSTERWRHTMAASTNPGELFCFRADELERMAGYRFVTKNIVPGSAHFPGLLFSRQRPEDYFWMIEADVECRGNWGDILRRYEELQDDLICGHLQRYWQWPNWPWWVSLKSPANQPAPAKNTLLKGFLTAYRISLRALQHIDAVHLAGWRGHAEVLVPSLLSRNGYRVTDLNQGVTPCYLGDDQNPNPNPTRQSTLRWRPAIARQEFSERAPGEALLFHPVKDSWYFDGAEITDVAQVDNV